MTTQNSKKPLGDYVITFFIVIFMIAAAIIYTYTMLSCFPQIADAGVFYRLMFSSPALGLIFLALYIITKEL